MLSKATNPDPFPATTAVGHPSSLFGMTARELGNLAAAWGLPAFRARQLMEWLYRRDARETEAMTSLPAALRERLAESFSFGRGEPAAEAVSGDGTRKYLFDYDGRQVETAWIPSGRRATLCLSTQAGCGRACAFCMTGRQGLQGNLSAGEILNQYASCPLRTGISNLVLMGMGEPFDNPDAVLKALEVLTSPEGYALSPGRITVSTVGVRPGLLRFLAESRAHLAISLHHPFPDERAALVPAEGPYPAAAIVDDLKAERARFAGQRRLTFEYILFDGLNDSPRHAAGVVRLLDGLRCRVNLIPFNPAPGLSFRPSPPAVMEAFQRHLLRHGLRATLRASRGADIGAACGLLSTRRPME